MKSAAKNFFVFLFFLVLTLGFTFPLVQYLNQGFPYTFSPTPGNEVIPFQQSDSVQQFYHFWMAWDYVTGGPGPFFADPYEFKMEPHTPPVFTTRRLLISLLYLVLAPLGTVFAFNALLILTLTASCFFAFLLAKQYTGKYFPSIVAGFIFGLSPFALAQSMGGHTNGYLLFLIPFTFFYLEKGIQTNKIIYYLLTTLALSCFAFIEYHLLYYMAMFLPLFFLWRMAFERPGWKAFFKAVVGMGMAAGVSVAVMLFVKSFEIDASTRSVGRSFAEIFQYTPTVHHFFHRDYAELEKVVYIGVFTFGSALLSFLICGWKRSLFWVYLGLLLGAALLCLGPGPKSIPLYTWLHAHLPYFGLSRLPARMMVLVMLAAAVLIALGLSRFKKGGVVVSLLFLAVVVWDYFPRSVVGITRLPEKSKVYQFIEEQGQNKNVLCLPIWPGDSSWASHYLYQITQHKVSLINGYYPVVPQNYVEKAFYPLYSVNVGELSRRQWELLKKFNVRYIVVHQEAFPGKVSHFPSQVTIESLKNNPYVQFVMRDRNQTLFELLDAPRKVAPKKITTPIGIYLTKQKLHSGKDWLVDHTIQILPPGPYQAEIELQGNGAQGIAIQLLGKDPWKRENREYVAPELLTTAVGKEGRVVVPFQLKKGMLVQFQVEKPKQGSCTVEKILLRSRHAKKTPTILEAEELFFHGEVVEDPQSSGGQAVFAHPETVEQKEMLFGPYREYPAGNYQVSFWIRIGESKTLSPLALLDVVTDYGQQKIAEKELTVADFPNKKGVQPIELSFSLTCPEVLEFRVTYLRKVPLTIDKIEIKWKNIPR